MLNINNLRGETPGCEGRLHLDNAGSSFQPKSVLGAVNDHLKLETEVGGYVAEDRQFDKIEKIYTNLANMFGGEASDYATSVSATNAWSRAFYSYPLKEGDNIIVGFNEYCASFVSYLQISKRLGVELRIAGAADQGKLTGDQIASLIDDKTKLICASFVPSSCGQINDVASIGKVAKAANIPFLLDAVQGVGQLPVNVDEIGCDMMTGTGRKFLRGPRGTAFLYVSKAMREKMDPVVLTNQAAVWVKSDEYKLRDDARIFEEWEANIAAKLGLSAAIKYLDRIGPDAAYSRISELAKKLRGGLATMPNVAMACPSDAEGAIITFNVDGHEAAEIKGKLEAENIAVQVARVEHTRLDMEARGLETSIRVSPHYYNTEAEIDRFLERIENGF